MPASRAILLALALALPVCAWASEAPPLPDLLGDEPTDGTPAGLSAPAPPAVEPTPDDRALLEQLKRAADRDTLAAEKLSDMYTTGLKVERDLKAAARYLREAIRLGSTTAPNKLGVLLATGGPGLLRDPAEALERFREGAKARDPKALYNLGQQYRSGELVERDEAAAFDLFRQAAGMKLPDALANVGIMKMEGLGTPADPRGAVQAWQEAAARNNVRACYFLGLALARGQGVNKDVAEARKWLQKAIAREYVPAVAALNALERRQ